MPSYAAIARPFEGTGGWDERVARSDLGWFYPNMTWVLKEGAIPLPQGARFITCGFHTQRFEGYNNDGYLDDAFLELRKVFRPIRVSDGNVILTWTEFGTTGVYYIEHTADLTSGVWDEVSGPLTGASSSPIPISGSGGYYRVRGE